MTITRIVIIFSLLVGMVSPPLSGDIDLVELQKKEKERRKRIEKSKYKLTNKNISSIDVPEKKYSLVQVGDTLISESSSDSRQSGRKKPADPRETREYWQNLKRDLEKRLEETRQKAVETRAELNRLNGEYLRMDLPLRKNRIKDRIDQLNERLEREEVQLRALQRELDRLPERARKAGVPPGWVR